ncbi:uncharacterized protein LAJ45_01798 [Morchella importuna]|uniref:uncharacterized protein n=1 Tax=Morchella importuna TaxID=1174673 RepID=UPI001E8EE542|nr:uncharacterized protein LAJ45_01798 [Morchella importuna]KAH8154031.1 hypothetical protein LAJ45_01798 [Morchella importuna]
MFYQPGSSVLSETSKEGRLGTEEAFYQYFWYPCKLGVLIHTKFVVTNKNWLSARIHTKSAASHVQKPINLDPEILAVLHGVFYPTSQVWPSSGRIHKDLMEIRAGLNDNKGLPRYSCRC